MGTWLGSPMGHISPETPPAPLRAAGGVSSILMTAGIPDCPNFFLIIIIYFLFYFLRLSLACELAAQ